MSVPRGPTRMILIRSGVYDYAELELHVPLHLVAANNVGKTSLISALQFLYIDDAQQMHFAHNWSDTKRHYFPDSGSFILFECMTPTGFQVFGLRGLGPAQGYKFARFTYVGNYHRDDFINDRIPRGWDEITSILIARDLRKMKSGQLRASLTASGGTRGEPVLGLVPLTRNSSYDSFRFLFQNLLRLSRIEQNRLKQLFIDICRPRLRQTDIDLRSQYAELFAKIERQTGEVEALQSIAEKFAALVERYAERNEVRSRLVVTWKAIDRGISDEKTRVDTALQSLEQQKAVLNTRIEQQSTDFESVNELGQQLAKKLAVIELDIKNLKQLRDKTRDFVPSIEETTRDNLQREYDDVVARLATSSQADRPRTNDRLRELRRDLEQSERMVEHFDDAFVNWLRKRTGLNDDALADIFEVANPVLLGEIPGEGKLRIDDEAELIALFHKLHEHIDDEGLSAAGIHIARRGPSTPGPLDRYENIEAIHERMRYLRGEEQSLVRILQDLDARDALLNKRQALDQKISDARQRLKNWELWTEQEPQLEELIGSQHEIEQQRAETKDRVRTLQQLFADLTVEQNALDRQTNQLLAALKQHLEAVRNLSPPFSDWSVTQSAATTPEDTAPTDLATLITSYTSGFHAQRKLAIDVDRLFQEVHRITNERFLGANEKATIERLKDELAALDDREKSLKELWASLVDGMRNAFKSLIDGVDEINRKVQQLNRAFNQRRVSNLEEIHIELVRQKNLTARLQTIIDAEAAPLFANAADRARAVYEIKALFEDRPQLKLTDLFDLRFKVVDVRGRTKSFDSLSQIESQGTSTTIKVLVHLELLRMMFADETVKIPFFLDEVATLDAPNLRALIEHASAMNFVPVVASPEARDCVDVLYFLRPSDGQLVLDETSRIDLDRESNHAL